MVEPLVVWANLEWLQVYWFLCYGLPATEVTGSSGQLKSFKPPHPFQLVDKRVLAVLSLLARCSRKSRLQHPTPAGAGTHMYSTSNSPAEDVKRLYMNDDICTEDSDSAKTFWSNVAPSTGRLPSPQWH